METNIVVKRGCCPLDPYRLCKHLPLLKCKLLQVHYRDLADGSTHSLHYVNRDRATWWAMGVGVSGQWENWTVTACSCVVLKTIPRSLQVFEPTTPFLWGVELLETFCHLSFIHCHGADTSLGTQHELMSHLEASSFQRDMPLLSLEAWVEWSKAEI